jgi:phosphoglycerol transferase MdoB-like AlkP superfamily enzyme
MSLFEKKERPLLQRMKNISAKADAALKKMEKRPVIFCIVLAMALYLIVEMLSRRSVTDGIAYLAGEPLIFIYNSLIVTLTLSVAWLFRKKRFILMLISLIWIGLGLVNCILLGYRTTPLNFMDFRTFKDVMSIMNVYFSPWQIVMMFVGAALFIAFAVFMFIKTPKEDTRRLKALASVAALSVMLSLSTNIYVSSGSLATTFHNIHDAYKQYGFAYCFASSVVNRGISQPDDYSEESVSSIVDRINEKKEKSGLSAEIVKSDKATEETPNIVILQLESFFDVNHLKDVTYSENPLPYFNYLKENYSSGYLLTPSFGAGTSNTEFEVLTGMSMDYFGPGEYPYTTIMRETTSESVAYDLKDYGYATHAIHDHTGRFYGRYLVYPNLGFDSFTSVEYMQNVERNALNWADDSCLTGEITKAMQSTPEQDFVFAVSVQGHGKYPSEQIDDTQTITSQGFNEDETAGFDYYINQINDMDKFLKELTDELSASDEPTVLVAYGDHLPKFSIEASDLENNNPYQTEYVIWDNFGMAQEDKDLTCYQLYSQVMKLLGMDNGIMTGFQQHCIDDDTYYSDLRTLQYDILYGKCYTYGGTKPFQKTDMHMGIDPITVSEVRKTDDIIYLTGENLTYASKIFVNGDQLNTTFIDSNHIMAKDEKFKEGDIIEVVQLSSKKTHLSSTGQYYWYEDGLIPYIEDNADFGTNAVINGYESEDDINEDIASE